MPQLQPGKAVLHFRGNLLQLESALSQQERPMRDQNRHCAYKNSALEAEGDCLDFPRLDLVSLRPVWELRR